ncbi:MAG: hypothetical protein M1483_08880 [Actinobacteria bacterium]|nr:hypothetical protein [Actinomycetota bacterium]MCL6105717.1 hypothetical protein [Actinomycetota bacterium]
MSQIVDSALRSAIRKGLKKGLFGGSRLWMAMGIVAFVVTAVKRGTPRVVSSNPLKPGESLLITHLSSDSPQHYFQN